MADLVIQGMEMPKNCAECPCLSEWDDCGINHEWKFADEFDNTKGRLPSCPLIPLPEGHGRLIDGDKLAGEMKNRKWIIGRASDPDCLVFDAPTIVPAEGGVEE